MLFMEKDENGFQNFLIRILESTESLRQVVLDEFENFIFNSNIMSGINKIDEPTLLSLICESHKSEYIREFIVEMLPLLEQSCITDRVFDSCISYSDTEFRKTLCILLAHMWLRIDLLLTLNEELDTPEAFIKGVCIIQKTNLKFFCEETSTFGTHYLAAFHGLCRNMRTALLLML